MLEDYVQGGGTGEISDNQLMFFLEEHVIMALCAAMKVDQHNPYATNPVRLLISYPGPMLKHHAYILQNDLLDLGETSNPYQYCHYDLEKNILYDAMHMNIDSYDYTSGR